MNAERPIGPAVDPTPRPRPQPVTLTGRYCVLEPLDQRHVPELWKAAATGTRAGDESWDYLGYGPFEDEAAMAATVSALANQPDAVAWAVRPLATGVASGWLTLMDIQQGHAAIELGNVWFAPVMQHTSAAREAIFMLLRLAADDLGYRRLVWKCNAFNAASRRAALSLGFTYEGELRAHYVVKGRRRDTSMFSIVAEEWPPCREALQAWLDPANFDDQGKPRASLASLRRPVTA